VYFIDFFVFFSAFFLHFNSSGPCNGIGFSLS
jgi:hypothetical protein